MAETPQAGHQVLVAAASKHGATAEIAAHIGKALGNRNLSVSVADAGEIRSVEGYDAVIVGSGVYAGHWLGPAKDLADTVAAADPMPAVWLFSSGPVGDPPKPDEDPVDVAAISESTSARDHQLFAGKIDKSLLNFGERAITAALRAPVGDFRDWDAIEEWADGIADELQRG